MYDVITLGDVTMDLFFKGKSLTIEKDRFHLALGGKYTADTFYETLGGGGANVAAGVAHHGLKTAVCGRVGENPFKQIIIQKLTQRHVSRDLLVIQPNYTNISSILLTDSGEKTVIHYCNRKQNFIPPVNLYHAFKGTKWLYMGNLPDMSIKERIIILSEAHKHGVKICLNIGALDCKKPLAELKPLITLADIFIINTFEFAEVIKKKQENIDFKKNCLSTLKIPIPLLILTNSKKGSAAYTKEEVFFQPAFDPPSGSVVDTTGAGDAYIAGFISHFIESNDIKSSMKAASEYACIIIGKIGAQ